MCNSLQHPEYCDGIDFVLKFVYKNKTGNFSVDRVLCDAKSRGKINWTNLLVDKFNDGNIDVCTRKDALGDFDVSIARH